MPYMEVANGSSQNNGAKQAEEAPEGSGAGGKAAAQCSVITLYKANIGGATRSVTVVWTKTLINHSLSITIDRTTAAGGEAPSAAYRVDLKPWPFWSKKGFKCLDVEGHRVDLFWDLRSAKFSGGGSPEPAGGFYVALVSGEEVVLLLGDCKKEAYKRTKSRPSLEDAVLVSKRDNVFGKRSFATRARLDSGGRREHDIVVESSISGGWTEKDPEMWISVDGTVVIHVSNLRWKFRGNQTVVVERSPVQVFWDVHDWLFGGPGMGHALFIFKPGAAASLLAVKEDEEDETEGGEAVAAWQNEGCGGAAPEFCHFLYAWKVE